jgi:hypothetical protein
MTGSTNPTGKRKQNEDRLALGYCPRCGALRVGVADQPFCGLCLRVLHWLYGPAPHAPQRDDEGGRR